MGSMYQTGTQSGFAQPGEDVSNTERSAENAAGHSASAADRPHWAGVTTGRDGLLGRIETTLGSIS